MSLRDMPVQAQRKVEVQPQLLSNVCARRRWVVSTTLRPLYPWQMPCYPLYTRMGGTQGWSGQARNISSKLGLDFRIFPSEVSHDYAIQSVITLSY